MPPPVPLITGIGRKLYEVLDNVTVVNMSYFTTFLSINMNTWNKLPPDLQKIVQDAANERSAEQLQILNQYLIDAKSLFEKMALTTMWRPSQSWRSFKMWSPPSMAGGKHKYQPLRSTSTLRKKISKWRVFYSTNSTNSTN